MERFNLNNLTVYQKSKSLSLEMFSYFSKRNVPKGYQFIVLQLLRAISSIGANISEGFGRLYKKSYRQFLSISRGSSYESLYWLEIANSVGLIDNELLKSFSGQVIEIVKMLTTMMKNLELDTKQSLSRSNG